MSVKKGEIFIDNNHKHIVYLHIAGQDNENGHIIGPMIAIERDSGWVGSIKMSTVASEVNVLRAAVLPEYAPAINPEIMVKEGV